MLLPTAFVAASILPLLLLLLGTIALTAIVAWLALVLMLRRKRTTAQSQGDHDDAAEAALLLHRLWPFDRAAELHIAELILKTDRCDTEALEWLARGLDQVGAPEDFARALVDRSASNAYESGSEGVFRALDLLRSGGSATEADLIRLAKLHIAKGGGDQARSILRKLIEEEPSDEALFLLRDLVIEQEDEGPEAEAILRESLMYDPDHEGAIMSLYGILEKRWDTLESSLGLYEKALALDGKLKWAHTAVAEILKNRGQDNDALAHYIESGQDAEAERILRRNFEKAPVSAEALQALRDFYFKRRRVDADARAIYERSRENRPDPEFDVALGELYEERGFHGAEAIDVLEKTTEKNADSSRCKILLALSYEDVGRTRDAVWLLEETREDFPDALDVQRELVRLYAAAGVSTNRALSESLAYIRHEYDETVAAFLKDQHLASDGSGAEVISAFEIWLKRHPEDSEVRNRLGRLYIETRDVERGIPTLHRLERDGKRPLWLIRGLADLYARSGDAAKPAEEALARAIAKGVADDEVLLALTDIYLGQNRRDLLAAEVYRRSTALDNCPVEAKLALAEFYFDQQAVDASLDLAREVLRLEPGHEPAKVLEARSLLKIGHVEGALEGLWQAWRASPGTAQATEELAQALVEQGDTSKQAREVYEAYLDHARKNAERADMETGTAVQRILGLTYFRTGVIDKGIATVQALYSRDASRPAGERLVSEISQSPPDSGLLEIGLTLLKVGDFSRARPFLRRALTDHDAQPGDIVGALKEARRAFPDRVAQILAMAETLTGAMKDSLLLHWELVECSIAASDLEDALARTRKWLGPGAGPDPVLPDALAETALARWRSMAGTGADSAGLLYVVGRLTLMAGNTTEAQEWLNRARKLDARDRHILHAAQRAVQRLIAKAPTDGLRENLADLYIEEGRIDEAIPILQDIPENSPRRTHAVAKLASCFIEKGHPLVASKNLERALGDAEVAESNAEMFYILAGAYEAAGDLRKAKLTFERIGFWRYDYRDVRDRLGSLAKRVESTPSTPVTPSPLSPVSDRMTLGGIETAELPEGRVEGGRFEILDLRGRGGMALVYKALDHEFDPPIIVALKVLPEEFVNREKAIRLLKREASAAIQLNHPGIVRIFSTGEEQGKRYISMEYIEGPDLSSILDRKGALPVPAVERYARETLKALGYAHHMGVIHKDIKPSNIMITEDTDQGRVKLTDFGIARVVSDQIGFSRTLSVRGTLPYMSPQQIAGEPADAQSDIYSLGITLYEMLAGDPPFMRGDVAYQHTYKAPPPLSEVTPDVPPRFAKVVMKCLEKKLVARYRNTEDILDDLG